MATIAQRVAAGAALLDEKRPGWWRRIDLDTLDIPEPTLEGTIFLLPIEWISTPSLSFILV